MGGSGRCEAPPKGVGLRVRWSRCFPRDDLLVSDQQDACLWLCFIGSFNGN